MIPTDYRFKTKLEYIYININILIYNKIYIYIFQESIKGSRINDTHPQATAQTGWFWKREDLNIYRIHKEI